MCRLMCRQSSFSNPRGLHRERRWQCRGNPASRLFAWPYRTCTVGTAEKTSLWLTRHHSVLGGAAECCIVYSAVTLQELANGSRLVGSDFYGHLAVNFCIFRRHDLIVVYPALPHTPRVVSYRYRLIKSEHRAGTGEEASEINRPREKSARAVGKSRSRLRRRRPRRRPRLGESEFRPGPRDQSDWECDCASGYRTSV